MGSALAQDTPTRPPPFPLGPHTFHLAGKGPEQADRVLPAQGTSGSWQTGGVGSSANMALLMVTAEGPGEKLATARRRLHLCTPSTEFLDFPV